MDLHFEALENTAEGLMSLTEFLTSDTWEFHGVPSPAPEAIKKQFENGIYVGEEARTFWVTSAQGIKVGLIRLYDLQDPTPVFDIRIHSRYRGIGVGPLSVKWLIGHIFESYEDKDRVEAYTRQDNYPMRTVFHKCGFVKEAHHRKAWKDHEGKLYDAIGYGILREDWKTGERSPVDWRDFNY